MCLLSILEVGLPYLAHGCMNMRECVWYIHDSDTTLTFDIKSKFKGFMTWFCAQLFSSPELKAQVSFSNQNLFVVVIVVGVVVNFSHFHLLLQNHWANFNQTWHKASLGEGNSSLFKLRAPPFSKGR